MSLYARSDLMSISIPVTSGGCGGTHSRPVTRGAPAKVWRLDCDFCETNLRGDGKGKIIKVIPGDKEQGIPGRMEHVPDSDPMWSNSPEGIPPTPDEQHINKIRAERGASELQMLQALIAAKGSGINIPDNAMWLLNQTFDPRIIKGQVVCANGHENTAGAKFCQECSIKMTGQGIITAGPELPGVVPLEKLNVNDLRAKCKQAGLPAGGKKAELLERLLADQAV